MVDVTGLPVVDIHAHPFLERGPVSVEEFTNLTAFGGGDGDPMSQPGKPRSPMRFATSSSASNRKRSTSTG